MNLFSLFAQRELPLLHNGKNLGIAFVLTCALLVGYSGLAQAHGEYVSSDPAANAMLTKAPTMITVHFAEEINPQGSGIQVYDVDGKQVSTGQAQVDRADLKAMKVDMKPSNSEVYVVTWHNVSAVEGHHDSGSFRFFVNISPMLKNMLGNGSMSQSSMNGISSSSSQGNAHASMNTASSSNVPIWIAGLIGLLGLVIGGISIAVFMRRPAAHQVSTKQETSPGSHV